MPTTAPTRKPVPSEATEKRKMSFYLTDAERRDFLAKRGAAGHTDNSAFIVAALALDTDAQAQAGEPA